MAFTKSRRAPWGAGDRAPASDAHGIYLIYLWLATGPIGRLVRWMRHKHDLRPVAVSYQVMTIIAAVAPTIPQTYVLLRCDCGRGPGHLASMTLAGRWTLAQLRGVPEPELETDKPVRAAVAEITA